MTHTHMIETFSLCNSCHEWTVYISKSFKETNDYTFAPTQKVKVSKEQYIFAIILVSV